MINKSKMIYSYFLIFLACFPANKLFSLSTNFDMSIAYQSDSNKSWNIKLGEKPLKPSVKLPASPMKANNTLTLFTIDFDF